MWEIWANFLLPKSNKSPNLVTLYLGHASPSSAILYLPRPKMLTKDV